MRFLVSELNPTTELQGLPRECHGEEREGEESEEGRGEEGGDGDEGERQGEEEDVQVEEAAGVGPGRRLYLDGAQAVEEGE